MTTVESKEIDGRRKNKKTVLSLVVSYHRWDDIRKFVSKNCFFFSVIINVKIYAFLL